MTDTPPADSQHLLHVQQLFVRHQQAVQAYVLSIEPNFADAQDITQQVVLTISRKAATWTRIHGLLHWVVAAAAVGQVSPAPSLAVRRSRSSAIFLRLQWISLAAALLIMRAVWWMRKVAPAESISTLVFADRCECASPSHGATALLRMSSIASRLPTRHKRLLSAASCP